MSTDTGLLSHNMYTYVNNNPIKHFDPNGHFILFGLLVGIVAVGSAFVANTMIQNNKAKTQIQDVQKTPNVPDKTKELDTKLKQSANTIKQQVSGKGPAGTLSTFYNKTKSYSANDIKRQDEWSQTILYNDIVMEAQDIGNFHFGYIGRAAGIPTDILVAGAGAYQLYEHGHKTVQNCFSSSACDDPRDTYYIRMGAIKYDNEN